VPAFVLNSDGGSRGNPGPAAAGFVLSTPEGEVVCRGGKYLGETTNNVAEYEALLWGLRTAIARGASDLTLRLDSELVVKQLNGQYRVKHENMKPLYQQAVTLLTKVPKYRVVHVRREHNKLADELANQAMDCRGVVGDVDESNLGGPEQGTLFG